MDTSIARKSIDKQLEPLKKIRLNPPAKGWIRAIRDALGLTTEQLAKRLKVSQPSITALEQDEVRQGITLARLEKAAQALDCTLVYALVPNSSLVEKVEKRAYLKAKEILSPIHRTMSLEAQGLTPEEQEQEYQELAYTLLKENIRRLWDEA